MPASAPQLRASSRARGALTALSLSELTTWLGKVPGWQGSPEDHWQSHWQNSLPNSARVEQADWLTPRREDWVAALAEAIAADSTPVILIAHSLGCITVAHWAATGTGR